MSLMVTISVEVVGSDEHDDGYRGFANLRLHAVGDDSADGGDGPFLEFNLEAPRTLVDPSVTLNGEQARMLAAMLLEAAEHAYGRNGEEQNR